MNHPEWTGKDLIEVQRQTVFGNGENEIGMSVVRIFVNDDPNQWYKAVPTAKDVISRGGIVFATPWNPPKELCETFTRTYTQWWDGKVVEQPNQKVIISFYYGNHKTIKAYAVSCGISRQAMSKKMHKALDILRSICFEEIRYLEN